VYVDVKKHVCNVHTCKYTSAHDICFKVHPPLTEKKIHIHAHPRLCNKVTTLSCKPFSTVLSLYKHRASCCLPHAHMLFRRSNRPTTARSRKQYKSESTLGHCDATVVVALSHKHYPINYSGAGPIQLVYGLHSCLAVELTHDKILFPLFILAGFVSQS